MKLFLLMVATLFFLDACASKTPPTRDISNAKMTLVKADTQESKQFATDALVAVKLKYQNLQRLMQEERYDEAQYLAQEIQVDARLLQQRSARIVVEKEVLALKQEIQAVQRSVQEK